MGCERFRCERLMCERLRCELGTIDSQRYMFLHIVNAIDATKCSRIDFLTAKYF